MQINELGCMGTAVRRQQTIDQSLQAIGFFNNDLGVFPQAFFWELEFQKLSGATNTAQGVFNLMR